MEITPTRAAILGQLGWRPQTAYELNQALAQHVRFLWPRAHSHLYREIKTLAKAGLANGCSGSTGRRPRTVYTITDAGREALRTWLASEPGGVNLEHEPLLRILYSASGRPEDLLAAAYRTRDVAQEMLAIGRTLGARYLDGDHEYQEEVHIRVFTFDLLIRWAELMADWSERVEAEVATWHDLAATPSKRQHALARIEEILASQQVGTAGLWGSRPAPRDVAIPDEERSK